MKPTIPMPDGALRALLVLLLAAPALPAQGRTVPSPQEFVTTQDDSLFSLTRSQEDVHQWEQALADLEKGANLSAVERLHRLLQTEIGGTAAVGPNRFVGLRHAVVLTLANLPPAAADAYEGLVRREAGSLLDRDLMSLRDEQLAMLAERFPTAAAGRRARLRLGDLRLEQGDGIAAETHFELAFEASRIGSEAERAARQRQLCADALMRSEALRTGEPGTEARSVLAVLPEAQDRTDWTAFGGGTDGSRPMADPVGRPMPHFADQIPTPGFGADGGSYAMQVVGGLDAVFVHTGLELMAVDPLRGELIWTSPSPLREQGEAHGPRDYPPSINQSMVLCAALGDDVVVAALQVPDESSPVRYQNAFQIVYPIPERRLFAFQRSTGKLLWSHFDRLEGPVTQRFRGHSSCGPPLIVGDTVYAPVHDRSGAIAFYLGAYDLRTGQPRWRRLVCSSQQEVNMFGNARMEFAASPLCASGGLLYGASNLGVAFAVERATGRVRWITAYDVIRMPPAQLQGQDSRTVYFHNSPPAVADGVVCVTPLDCEFALGLDAESGDLLWRVPHQAKASGNNDVRWLCGGSGGEFVLAGAGVVAVRARPDVLPGGTPPLRLVRGREFLRSDDRSEQPRPALSGRWIYYPTDQGVSVFDLEGNLAPASAELRLQSAGNLLLVDGIVVAVGNSSFEVLLDREALRARAEDQLKKTPDDPSAILRLCTLRAALDGGDGDASAALEALYGRGLQVCANQGLPKDHPLHAMFLRRLFEIALQRGERTAGAEGGRLLATARDFAPDTAAFLRVQSTLLERAAGDPAALRRELDVLAQRAAGASHPLPLAGGTIDVDVYVLWRRTLLAEDSKQQVAGWQELLTRHGDAVLQRRNVAELAQQTIRELIAAHGRGVYAEIEARAARALAEAGQSSEALRAVGRSFPHSEAAAAAQKRLLDGAVAEGDLATAVDVFQVAARGGDDSPGILRRLCEAARRRGNHALARAAAQRLLSATGASDWPADGGRTFAAVAAEVLAEAEAAPAVRAVPSTVVAEIPSPRTPMGFRLLPVHREAGFPTAGDEPLLVGDSDQLHAIDLHDEARPTLFTWPSGIVERLWLCGGTIVVPGLDPTTNVGSSFRIVGLDRRTGAMQWQFTAPGRMLVCYGVVNGVLQVTQRDSDDTVVLLGIEPLTGRTLYSRPLADKDYAPQPRPTADDVLVLRRSGTDDSVVERVDPLTGRSAAGFVLGQEVRRAATHLKREVLQSGLLSQRFSATADLLFVPIDSALNNGTPLLLAVRPDGSVAWSWTGARNRRVLLEALRGDRFALVEAGATAGRALVFDAATGTVLREVALGNEATLLNWSRLRIANPAPEWLLLSDLDDHSGDRRLIGVPLGDGEAFAHAIGGAGDEVLRTPRVDGDRLVFGVRSQRTPGPVRLFVLRVADRRSALPDDRSHLLLPVPQRSPHELGTAGPYTVLVTETRLYVLGDGKENR